MGIEETLVAMRYELRLMRNYADIAASTHAAEPRHG